MALHYAYYNVAKIRQTLRVTPAMEAGIADYVWSIDKIVGLLNWRKSMPYLLLALSVVIGLFGIAKIRRAAQPSHGVPWGPLLVWAGLFGGGLSIWLMMSN